MSSSLSFTTQITQDNKIEITCSVGTGGTLPKDIFIYENTGTNTLGSYIGVCNLEEYQRLQTFQGDPIRKFGNKFIKYTEAKVTLGLTDDPNVVINHITNTASFLSIAMSNPMSTTKIITIP